MFLNGICNSCYSWISRFLGSKTWSLPQYLFNKIFNSELDNPDINWNATNYQWSFISQEESAAEIKKNLYKYVMAAVPKSENTAWITPFNIGLLSASQLGLDLEKLPGTIEIKDNSLVDYSTGLKAIVAESACSNEILVGFGAADSLLSDVSPSKGLKYIFSAGVSLLGGTPLIYSQAEKIVAALKEKYPDKKIILSGTCLGASLAEYAAFQNGVKAYCVNSLPLGVGLQAEIGNAKLREHHNKVHHVTVSNELFGDRPWITILDKIFSFLGFRTAANFGLRFSIPCTYNSAILDHSYPLDAVVKVIVPDHKASAETKNKRRRISNVYNKHINGLIENGTVQRPKNRVQ
ncbi:MAG: hypothetical protein WC222_07655 [Parachlamydiales bacterium]|jgi:hypothetical protein